ncbi:MAG: NADH-quinone oxidoreductase subunit J [Candidatus Hydrogenedentota bacterium]
MILSFAFFSFFAAVTIGFGIVVAVAREIFRAAFALLGTLCGVAGMIAVMGAPAVAALQVLIYVGGVFVLFLFAILVTERPKETIFRRSTALTMFAGVGACIIAAVLVVAMASSFETLTYAGQITARAMGTSLIFDNLLVFEAVSILLLAGLAAAVMVIRKELSA